MELWILLCLPVSGFLYLYIFLVWGFALETRTKNQRQNKINALEKAEFISAKRFTSLIFLCLEFLFLLLLGEKLFQMAWIHGEVPLIPTLTFLLQADFHPEKHRGGPDRKCTLPQAQGLLSGRQHFPGGAWEGSEKEVEEEGKGSRNSTAVFPGACSWGWEWG